MFEQLHGHFSELGLTKRENAGDLRRLGINPQSERESRKLLKDAKRRQKKIEEEINKARKERQRPVQEPPEDPNPNRQTELEIINTYRSGEQDLDNIIDLNSNSIRKRAKYRGLKGKVTFCADFGRPSPTLRLRGDAMSGMNYQLIDPELSYARAEGTNVVIDLYPSEIIRRSIKERRGKEQISPNEYAKQLHMAVDTGLQKARAVQLADKKMLIDQYLADHLKSLGIYTGSLLVSSSSAFLLYSLPHEWKIYAAAIAATASVFMAVKASTEFIETHRVASNMQNHFYPYFTHLFEFIPAIDRALSWVGDKIHFIKQSYVTKSKK